MNVSKAFAIGLTVVVLILFGLSFWADSLLDYKWYFFLGAFIALSFVSSSRLVRVGFATVTLIALTFFVAEFISRTSLGNKSIDLTEDDRYTLTDGTRAILTELKEPVTINYYVTRDVDGTPSAYKRHIPRVDSFLRQIEALAANDLITLNFIDPKPNTDEEDSALLDQVQPIPVTQDDKLLFGASISSLEKKTVIPFFTPSQETQLEYQVIDAIAKVTQRQAPVVGLISALDLSASNQGRSNWLFYELLEQSYDVANLGMMPTASLEREYDARDWDDVPDYLDPEKIPLILVIHPAGITPEAEYELDQYLLRGGTVIACVDPFSIVAQQTGRPPAPGLPPQGGVPTSSSLPKLFAKHSVAFNDYEMIVDRVYASSQQNPLILRLDESAITVKDDIALSKLKNMEFLMAGGFTGANGKNLGAGLEASKLVQSSLEYSFLDEKALEGPEAQNRIRFALQSRREGEEKQTYVAHLAGKFSTAFPEGAPSTDADAEEKDDASDSKEDDKQPKSASLTEGEERGNLYLISDSDFLFVGMGMDPRRGQVLVANPLRSNLALMFNLLDQTTGSKHLIGARARAEIYRPFTVLKEKEAEFEKIRGEKLEKLRKKREDAQANINRISTELSRSNNTQRNEQVRAEYAEYQKVLVDASKQIRDEEKSYQADVDSLKADIFWRNILYMPLTVIAIGLAVFIWRKRQTKAQ